MKPLSPLKVRWGTWGIITSEATAGAPGLGTPAASTLREAEAREGMGLAPQRPHVAASRAAAGVLPIFPSLLPARYRSRTTQFLEHAGRVGLEREMLDAMRMCTGMLEELIGR